MDYTRYSKTCLKRPLKRNPQNMEHSAFLSTFTKPPSVFKTLVVSIFKWRLKTGFTLCLNNKPSLTSLRRSCVSVSGDRLRNSGPLVCVVCDVLSVPCSLVITCWESSDLLTLLCCVFLYFVTLYR